MDVLDHLADVVVPPMPSRRTFTAGVQRKLHPRLLAAHLVEFAVGATAWGVMHMAVALLATVRFTATGRWPPGLEEHRRRGDAS